MKMSWKRGIISLGCTKVQLCKKSANGTGELYETI